MTDGDGGARVQHAARFDNTLDTLLFKRCRNGPMSSEHLPMILRIDKDERPSRSGVLPITVDVG
jgi:hypothetical protein